MKRRTSLATGVIVLFVLLPAMNGPPEPPERRPADFKETFREGIEANNRGEWAEADALMREALKQKPESGEPYLPHYYLGRALFHQDKCEEALRQIEKSLAEGFIQTKPRHYKESQRIKAECERR